MTSDTESASRTPLFGRAELINAVIDTVEAGVPVTVLTGPAGIGRSALLTEMKTHLAPGRFSSVIHIRLSPTESAGPATLSLRLLNELITMANGRNLAGLLAGVSAGPAGAGRVAAGLAGLLAEQGRTLVLLDDLQWIDTDSLVVLESLVRQLAGGRALTCVVTARWPAADAVTAQAGPVADRLRRDGLLRLFRLRPLGVDDLTALTAQTLQAIPDSELIGALRQTTRGVPGALLAALAGYRAADAVRTADRHGYLIWPREAPALPERHELFAAIRQLGAAAWAVAKAMAVLHPLGPAAPALVAVALGDEPEGETNENTPHPDTGSFSRTDEAAGADAANRTEWAIGVLGALEREGVLRRTRSGWRFRVPVVARALTARLGPYERRQLAQVAVTALWQGTATTDDPNYLADQLANAGRLVDADRARQELLHRAGLTMLDDGHRAAAWLRAAADLTTDAAQLAGILFLHAATCCIHGDFAASVRSSTTLLRDHAHSFSPDWLLELEIVHVTSLRGMGDVKALERLVSTDWRELPGRPGQRLVAVAAAMGLLDRWREAHELLQSTQDSWRTDGVSADLGNIFLGGSGLWLGQPQHFDTCLANPDRWRLNEVDRHHLERVTSQVRLLLMRGDLVRAEALLHAEHTPVEQLTLSDRAMLAGARGDWTLAMDLARRSIASGIAPGYEPGHVAMHHMAASILWAYGQPTRARTLLQTARAAGPVLPYLLDASEAAMDAILGSAEQAKLRLWQGLDLAKHQGFVIGTDVLWFQLAVIAVQDQDEPAARNHLAELETVAEAMDGGRPELHVLLVRALLDRDRGVSAAAVRLARQRAQQFELAYVIDLLVRYGVGDPGLLTEAYELFGDLGALLYRAWARNLMREHDIVVPGRQATVAENERLLAELVTEGLSNRQLANVLQASEKSVEGRLSRLFARTGYRSRVELAAAMLTGDYPSS